MILVDADACPVKDEVYTAAYRHACPVRLVANQYLRHPDHPLIALQMVHDGFDAADDAIAAAAGPGTLVLTADILLAERCLKAGAPVLSFKGTPFTENSIGGQIATRAILADLRGGIESDTPGGPKPFTRADRGRFSNALEAALRKLPR